MLQVLGSDSKQGPQPTLLLTAMLHACTASNKSSSGTRTDTISAAGAATA
jgi:hypothetical protein